LTLGWGFGEFNPPGFREIFWADFPGGAPERGIILSNEGDIEAR
jgi:hypothetical protein